MSRLVAMSCGVYEWVMSLYDDRLRADYGDEMRLLFEEQMTLASERGLAAAAKVWGLVVYDTACLVGPTAIERLGLVTSSVLAACAVVLCFVSGFCTVGDAGVRRVCAQEARSAPKGPGRQAARELVQIPGGHRMFLECTGESHGGATIVLATGRGIGSYRGWSLVQAQIAAFARVCSYDPLGGGESDPVAGSHPVSEVVESLQALLHTARVPGPYILIGASLGGILVRAYEQRYPTDVAGLVFVDSAHEEMEWRDAAIAPSFDPNWKDQTYLEENALLPPGRR